MTQMVTRCPKCATAFRITSTQLESAKGAVRCGSCLHIFKAQDFLVKTPVQEAPTPEKKPEAIKPIPLVEQTKVEQLPLEPSQPETIIAQQMATASEADLTEKPVAVSSAVADSASSTAKPVIDKAKILADEEDVLISDDMDQVTEKDSAYEFDGFMDIDMRPKQTVSLFEREIRYEIPREDQEQQEDESWAEDLLDDNEEVLHQLKKPAPPISSQPTNSELADENADEQEANLNPTTAYTRPVFSLIDETPETSPEENAFSQEFLNATQPTEDTATRATEAASFAEALFNSGENPHAEEEQKEESKPGSKRPVKSSKMRAFDTSRAALLMNIMPAPVEFTAKRMRRWYQRRLWSVLSLLMAVLLFFQAAYFKFDYFSRVEPYRTAYLFMCPVFGCEVPTLIDTNQILATNLIVRNHPEVANALMVDAILINNAPFEQPFPSLILSFSKLDETPVATRRFTPNEYLAGELAGMQHIPVRQPVHITLEIADPGPDAVNYTLATH
jgi:predicted Zn finger-like uncharacterized protein